MFSCRWFWRFWAIPQGAHKRSRCSWKKSNTSWELWQVNYYNGITIYYNGIEPSGAGFHNHPQYVPKTELWSPSHALSRVLWIVKTKLPAAVNVLSCFHKKRYPKSHTNNHLNVNHPTCLVVKSHMLLSKVMLGYPPVIIHWWFKNLKPSLFRPSSRLSPWKAPSGGDWRATRFPPVVVHQAVVGQQLVAGEAAELGDRDGLGSDVEAQPIIHKSSLHGRKAQKIISRRGGMF